MIALERAVAIATGQHRTHHEAVEFGSSPRARVQPTSGTGPDSAQTGPVQTPTRPAGSAPMRGLPCDPDRINVSLNAIWLFGSITGLPGAARGAQQEIATSGQGIASTGRLAAPQADLACRCSRFFRLWGHGHLPPLDA